jgi:hypothetical protein
MVRRIPDDVRVRIHDESDEKYHQNIVRLHCYHDAFDTPAEFNHSFYVDRQRSMH